MTRSKLPHERRRHVVYITLNTEYHCRDQECVGVRDRRTGRWHRAHPALRAELLGAVAKGKHRLLRPETGRRLLFSANQAVMTSPVTIAGRPDRAAVFHYTSLCWSGEIGAA
jgi:hypothetical protein